MGVSIILPPNMSKLMVSQKMFLERICKISFGLLFQFVIMISITVKRNHNNTTLFAFHNLGYKTMF